jgi:hypothetical protein
VIIIRKASITTASAMPSVPRVMVCESSEIGSATLKANHHQHDADQHGGGNVDQRLDLALDLELAHQAVQDPGQQRTLSASVRPAE